MCRPVAPPPARGPGLVVGPGTDPGHRPHGPGPSAWSTAVWSSLWPGTSRPVANPDPGCRTSATRVRGAPPVGRHPPPGLASLSALRPPPNLTGHDRTPIACLALRGRGRPVHGDGRAGLPRTQAALHPEPPRPWSPVLRPARLDHTGLPHAEAQGLAMTSLRVLAYGTRGEQALLRGQVPGRVRNRACLAYDRRASFSGAWPRPNGCAPAATPDDAYGGSPCRCLKPAPRSTTRAPIAPAWIPAASPAHVPGLPLFRGHNGTCRPYNPSRAGRRTAAPLNSSRKYP